MSRKKKIRSSFRSAVFERDGGQCQVCGRVWSRAVWDPEHRKVNAHHITDRNLMPNGGYVVENGITVCEDPCHMAVEQWHILGCDTDPQPWKVVRVPEHLRPPALYALIGSSHEVAVEACERLGDST